jgi:transaldolase
MTVSTRLLTDHERAVEAARVLRIQIFADGADRQTMVDSYRRGAVQGFTTNPTLMRKAGVTDYEQFAKSLLAEVPDVLISFEVCADDFPTMGRQARKIASWGENVFVKIPITDTRGDSSLPLVKDLVADGLKVNVTAVLTLEQCEGVAAAIPADRQAILSIFAGRIADTGRDPVPFMSQAVQICRDLPRLMVLWASPREIRNVYQADECGCDIITVTPDLLSKLSLRNKDLAEFSRETVQMFYDDARKAGYQL